MPVLKDNEEAGNYTVHLARSHRTSDYALMPNQNVQDDPVLSELFNNRDFRIALSHGIDRDAINDAIYFGLARPFPALPSPASSFFKPEWEGMYMTYDPDKSNEILDSLGLAERDGDGFRLRPDGTGRLSFVMELEQKETPKMEICELIVDQWKSIGIEGICRDTAGGGLFPERVTANEQEMSSAHVEFVNYKRSSPGDFGFNNVRQQRWAPAWCTWFITEGEMGTEAPEEIQDLWALFLEWQRTAIGTPEYDELGEEYFGWFAAEIPMIGTVGMAPRPIVVSNRLHNVPQEDIYWGSCTNFYAPYVPSQWYIKE